MTIEVMPRQVTAYTDDMSGGIYRLQSGASENLRNDDSGSGAEGRARKRFQKSTSDGSIALRRPELPILSTNNPVEPQSSFTSRRGQSIRDQKAPLGPRLAEFSPSKRAVHVRPSTSSVSVPFATSGIKQASHSRQSSMTTIPRYNVGASAFNVASEAGKPVEFHLLPPQDNHNDVHKVSGFEDGLTNGNSKFVRSKDLMPQDIKGSSIEDDKTADGDALLSSVQTASESRIGRSNSLLHRQGSSARQKYQSLSKTDAIGPPSLPPATKARRQSHFPVSKPTTTVNRFPRKSIGPGVLTTSMTHESLQNESLPLRGKPDLSVGNPKIDNGVPVDTMVSSERTPDEANGLCFKNITRSAKAKSFQPPSRLANDYLSMPSFISDNPWPMSIRSARSPVRSTDVGAITLSTGNRLSMMPGHVTGLGARTVSPTDIRRIKRMSMMPDPPPLPFTPPASQKEASRLEPRSATQSPPLLPRKSTTPSSNRTTPDHNRKSYSSGISNSSNTSYNSLRTSTGSQRVLQNSSHSRLPTAKNRTENTSSGMPEEVPPVPAIPKAYESPKSEFEMPFYSSQKPILPSDATSLNSTSTNDFISTNSSDKESLKTERETKHQQDLAVEKSPDEVKLSNNLNSNRILQPLRLPPINLLPLSTPTAAKVAALQDNSISDQSGTITPPLRRGTAKTPSTPMTASKATFFSRQYQKGDTNLGTTQLRSSSSHHALRSETSSHRAPSSLSSSARVAQEPRNGHKAISPFISSSLPKTSGDFSSLRTGSTSDISTPNIPPDVKSSRLTGPRAQTFTKASKLEAKPNSNPRETTTPSFGASLRRTLSLTRRRSSSKAQTMVDPDAELPPQPPKHDNMPPPRLPASATWNGTWLSSTSPTQKAIQLHVRRKTPNTDHTTKQDRVQSETFVAEVNTTKTDIISDEYALPHASSKPTESTTTSLSRAFTVGNSSGSLKIQSIDTKLDRSDLAAEEEMKRSALRRKDTEAAAKELDELKKRAAPKDRVSAAQALRTARLNIFERGEIVDFKEIYFCGTQTAAKLTGDLEAETANFGYDDDRGDYNIVMGDHLAFRYEVVDLLGKGSFGQVVRCIDHKTGGLVAIKIIRNKKRFHQQALVEVNILQKLREWDPQNKYSMVNFTQSFYFRGHLCISTELLGMNLYEFIKIHDFRGFSIKLIRRFTKQLLNSLVLLKSHKVIHCDLKPENILLAHPAHSEIKVIDFGSSCLENEKVYTYIQSRFYRSPEVILGMTYGMPIDMWSLGCILAELLTGMPIFPGENEQEQLACIMEVFGPPDKHLIERSTRKKLFFDSLGKPRLTVSSKGKRRRPSSKTLQQALKCDDEVFLDFISRCLRWDPDRRLKPDEAIHHEFITGAKPSTTRNLRSLPSSSTNVNSSPIKRYNSINTPASSIRPLPDPPTTTIKNGTSVKARETQNSGSPVKPAPKRHSTINGLQNNLSVKKMPNGTVLAPVSALPRLGGSGTPRAVSGKLDLATAAAAAATTKPR